MVDNMNKNEKLIKFALWGSVALDIFMYVCFVVGFAAGIGGAQIGFLMIGIVFRYNQHCIKADRHYFQFCQRYEFKAGSLFCRLIFIAVAVDHRRCDVGDLLHRQSYEYCGIAY